MIVVLQGDCLEYLDSEKLQQQGVTEPFALTFLDPPFRQGKRYAYFDDSMPEEKYWGWLKDVCKAVYNLTADGGSIYFMHREKNVEHVMRILRETGWVFQNLIIWKKHTSAVPCSYRYSKSYQIIVFATKGKKPRTFHRLRIKTPLPPHYKLPRREEGVFLTDVWDDIRELTSGYFAGKEALRYPDGSRICTQQTPVALLLRILLVSTEPGDWVLDPFAGTGTTLVVAAQLQRNAVGIEIDPQLVGVINQRLSQPRPADDIKRYCSLYIPSGGVFTGGEKCDIIHGRAKISPRGEGGI